MKVVILSLAAVVAMTSCAFAAPDLAAFAEDRLERALVENRRGNLDAALALYLQAYARDRAVLARDDEGLLENAGWRLEAQLIQEGDDPEVRFLLAEVRKLQGLPREAAKHYREVISRNPDSDLARRSRPLLEALEAQIEAYAKFLAAASARSAEDAATDPAGRTVEAASREESLQAQVREAERAVRTLRATAERQRLTAEANRQELEALRREFRQYQQRAERWKLYYTLFFADPENVEKLRERY